MKRFSERFIEGILFISSTVTSLTVLLIIIFLFKEGFGIFGESPTEDGFKLVVNQQNPVKDLSGKDIKSMFDQEITNWKNVGGKADSIILFRSDDIANFYTEEELGANLEFVPQKIAELIDKTPNIIAFIPEKYTQTPNFKGKIITIEKIGFINYFFGKEWFPTAQPVALHGILPLLLGTLMVSLLAIIFALPLGLATAIYLAEIAGQRTRAILKPVIELLAGIPSVIYGFFGLTVIVPTIQQVFDLPVGETALAGSVLLAIMALPTIITISEDALRNTPLAMREASLALGATHWQTISKVVIPYSISGITAAAMLGVGRAVGETMAVLMVTGNAAVIPHSLLEPVRTIPATIAAELGEVAKGGTHYQSLFMLGCILFLITMLINFTVAYISNRQKNA